MSIEWYNGFQEISCGTRYSFCTSSFLAQDLPQWNTLCISPRQICSAFYRAGGACRMIRIFFAFPPARHREPLRSGGRGKKAKIPIPLRGSWKCSGIRKLTSSCAFGKPALWKFFSMAPKAGYMKVAGDSNLRGIVGRESPLPTASRTARSIRASA
jgi:hypothetical protein